MHTITLQINDNHALKTLQTLESKHLISIIEQGDIDTPVLAGASLSLNAFKNWIKDAEASPTISLNDAKEKWASKRKKLQRLTK